MELRRCSALLLLDILGIMFFQCYVLADDDPVLFFKDDEKEELLPLFAEDAPEDICMEPPIPLHGEMYCGKLKTNTDRYVCKAQCDTSYEFPNREEKGKLICDLKSGEWSPNNEFPDCQKKIVCYPVCKNGGVCEAGNVCNCLAKYKGERCEEGICTPPCQNGGTCLEGNICGCPPHFIGDKCEIEVCKHPRGPSNGKMFCNKLINDENSYACVAKCQAGYHFPKEEKSLKHNCNLRTGLWTPEHEFPNCDAKCNPPCQNGGKCIKEGVCDCLGKFTGERCQYENCGEPEPPQNGKVSCRNDTEFENRYLCQGECDPGYQFPNAEGTVSHSCDLKSGEWTPKQELPDCKPKPCVPEWTEYFNTDHPDTSDIGDNETLNRIRERHDVCSGRTIKDIECKAMVVPNPVDYKEPDTVGLKCSKYTGFTCYRHIRQTECEDYAVRFLCDCGVTQKPTTPPLRMCPEVPSRIKNMCPASCPRGFACNGSICVLNEECPCFRHDLGFKPSKAAWTTENCQHCECTTGGHLRCGPMKCPDCLPYEKSVMGPNCSCSCVACPAGSVLCPSSGECVREQLLCSGDAECPGVEISCPTANPQGCVPEWTEYFNTDHPNSSEIGDNETLDRIRKRHDVCTGRTITAIECKAMVVVNFVDYKELDTLGLRCSKYTGFTCYRHVRQRECEDYAVRFLCDCAKREGCVPEWTEYFNTDHPDSSDIGDNETLDRIRKRHDVCSGRTIKDIECKAIVVRNSVDYKELDTVGMNYSKYTGFACHRHVRQRECEDFAVRFLCDCGVTQKPTSPPLRMCPEVPSHIKNKCPASCPRDLACDGSICVPNDDCPCFRHDFGFKPSKAAWTTENCERCECMTGGHLRCEPMKCPDCLPYEKSVMGPNCSCSCVACPAGSVLCPSSGECFREELLCSGDAECPDVAISCPKANPRGCFPEWTEYFNTDHPSSSDIGDNESVDRIRKRHQVCTGRTIKDIECKAIIFDKLVDYKELDKLGLRCSKYTGFTCYRHVRQRECEDFAVRFLCDCVVG